MNGIVVRLHHSTDDGGSDGTVMTITRANGAALCVALIMAAASASAASLTSEPFGMTADGKPVTRYVMAANDGVTVEFMSYGGIVTAITTPDRRGRRENIVLGFPVLRDYETKSAEGGLYLGAILGRYTNFIAGGRFSLSGHVYTLALNDPPNTIHGGNKGFDKQVWQVRPIASAGPTVGAELSYISPDGEEGYPGTLKASVAYTLSDDGTFTIHYEAVADRDTVVNLTNHSGFNLAGAGSPGGVLRQLLMVDADRYTPVDRTQIPLGPLAPVVGTPFDFRHPTAIGTRIRDKNEQLAISHGYDQNWVLNKRGDSSQPQFAARAYDPGTGRTLECLTTEPGVRIYTGGFLDGSYVGNGGRYGPEVAFTLETQHFPDSPNHPGFPTTELKPGQLYQAAEIWLSNLALT